ncbi:hypothetical protein F511_01360 [Dorcoceras hygrometricum]|uniref:SPRY domain-containing protein n=1 Tax=Dorcoceras hygrometricum TaxID=472368 RepID=A0A2Z7D4M2_9LAMI|nr:hypothetical protein F511_01360 [Dorcoceras hygrometricum]
MIAWLHVTLIVVSGLILALILVLILRQCFHLKTRKNLVISDLERGQSLRNGISRLHQMNHDLERDTSKKTNYYVLRHGVSTKKPTFSWADHPSLITDAVENGWSRFAFTALISSPSVKSAKSLLGVCAAGDPVDVEIAWEVCEGSADFMQKIRLNPGLRKNAASVGSSMGAVSVIRTALPLPGPHLGNSSFPQEAYFEITILSCNENIHDHLLDKERKDKSEGEKIKLIGEDFNAKMNSDSLNHVSGRNRIEDLKLGGKNEVIFLSVGFTGGGTIPLKIPGSYPGSIGFNSSGSVYLDGIKLVFDSGKEEWARTGKVIGCGYNPNQKKVFFTCDSQLVHEIHCKTEEFSYPLYPTMAANTDITVVVNLGQSPFKYLPGDRHRTPNPCFIGPMLGNSPSLGHEDSRELFSMGRIDSQWLQRSAMRSNNNTVNSIKGSEYDLESEGDLFEIVLDSTGRSPYAAATHQ